MAKKTAHFGVVTRDILVALLDMAGDWVYFCFVYIIGGMTHRDELYTACLPIVLLFSITGSVLELWVIATSIGRVRKFKSLCCRCTVPRLAMSLILLHHMPLFVLVTYIDMTFNGGDFTLVGWFNIGTTMLALVNTMAMTKCGESFCGDEGLCGEGPCGGDGYCGLEKAEIEEDDDMEIGTLADSVSSEDDGLNHYRVMTSR